MRALSLTQPWAWLVVHGGKDIENRVWSTKLRGRFLVHAAKGMTRAQYHDAVAFTLATPGGAYDRLPRFEDLELGGIIGSVELLDVLPPAPLPKRAWRMPMQFGFTLANPAPLPFVPCKGALGFWGDWRIEDGRAVRVALSLRGLEK